MFKRRKKSLRAPFFQIVGTPWHILGMSLLLMPASLCAAPPAQTTNVADSAAAPAASPAPNSESPELQQARQTLSQARADYRNSVAQYGLHSPQAQSARQSVRHARHDFHAQLKNNYGRPYRLRMTGDVRHPPSRRPR